MTTMAPVRGVLFVVALLAATATTTGGFGCGRTSLDEGFGPATGLGGTNGGGGIGAGAGGMSGLGGNAGGIGGSNAPNPCGTTSCQAGTQICCTRVVMGQTTQTCIPAGSACNGGIASACLSSSNCAAGQACCVALPNLATTCQAGLCAQSGQFTLCNNNGGCSAATPRCCLAAPGLGLCLPAAAPCP